jgi:hypothetical protein
MEKEKEKMSKSNKMVKNPRIEEFACLGVNFERQDRVKFRNSSLGATTSTRWALAEPSPSLWIQRNWGAARF